MTLEITDFTNYTDYPIALCKGYAQASEKEGNLAFMLSKAIEAKDMEVVIETKHRQDDMVRDGLLEEVKPYNYKITFMAYTLIHAHQTKYPNKVA